MTENRYAILIASSHFNDPDLNDLKCPVNDVDGFRELLASEEYGNFIEPTVLKDREHHEVLGRIQEVFNHAGRNDLVLIYYSGHGKLNRAGSLYLTTTNTYLNKLETTAISADDIKKIIDISFLNKVIIILDCCYSGAIIPSSLKAANVDEQIQDISSKKGTYIITATNRIQGALEQDKYGILTKHIIEGIKSGKADLDYDGKIKMGELYSYVRREVRAESHQEVKQWALEDGAELIISHSRALDDRRRKIKKTLFGLSIKEILPTDILIDALRIIDLRHDQLSKLQIDLNPLLDQLVHKRIKISKFIEEWNKIKEEHNNEPKLFRLPPESGRWVFVIVGLMIQLCLGAIYAYGALRGSIQAFFKSLGQVPTAMDMTWPFIVFLFVFAITMPLAGPYIQKVGPRKVCMVGGALCGLGWIAASFATSPFMLIPLYGIIGGLGVGIAYGCPIAVSAAWFPDRRGLAVGLTVLGFGLSSALISYSTKYMLGIQLPIMNILQIFGIVFLIVTVILSMFLAFPEADWCPAGWKPPAPKAGAAPATNFTRDEMSKTGAFRGLWLCYTIGALAGLTAIGIAGPVGTEVFTPIFAAQLGLAATAAEVIYSVKDLIFLLIIPFATINGLGRPVFGTLTDRLGPKNTALITYVLTFIACMLMYTQYSSGSAYIICFALLWACLGGWLAIAPTATASFFGTKDYAKNYGLVFTAYGIGALIGGILSAQAKDLIGAYQPFFLIVAVLAVLGAIVAVILMKPPTPRG